MLPLLLSEVSFLLGLVFTVLKLEMEPSTLASFRNIQSPNLVVGLNSNEFHELW